MSVIPAIGAMMTGDFSLTPPISISSNVVGFSGLFKWIEKTRESPVFRRGKDETACPFV